jgi:excisionase family DNA binding protein
MKSNTAAQTRQEPLLTPDDVAEILDVSRIYVMKTLCYERRIDFIKIGGKIRFERAAVDKFINERRVEAAP